MGTYLKTEKCSKGETRREGIRSFVSESGNRGDFQTRDSKHAWFRLIFSSGELRMPKTNSTTQQKKRERETAEGFLAGATFRVRGRGDESAQGPQSALVPAYSLFQRIRTSNVSVRTRSDADNKEMRATSRTGKYPQVTEDTRYAD